MAYIKCRYQNVMDEIKISQISSLYIPKRYMNPSDRKRMLIGTSAQEIVFQIRINPTFCP